MLRRYCPNVNANLNLNYLNTLTWRSLMTILSFTTQLSAFGWFFLWTCIKLHISCISSQNPNSFVLTSFLVPPHTKGGVKGSKGSRVLDTPKEREEDLELGFLLLAAKRRMVADKSKRTKVEEENAEPIDSELVLSIEKLQEIQDELEKVIYIHKYFKVCFFLCLC